MIFIGISIGVAYTGLFLIVANIDDRIDVSNYQMTKFLDDYDAQCIEDACIFQLNENIEFTSKENYISFLPSGSKNNIKVLHPQEEVETGFALGYTFLKSEFEYAVMDYENNTYIMVNKIGRDYKGLLSFILPTANGQILPFEQQLEQIRNPQECTRKVVQGKSAEIPFTLKVFYDTTRDVSLEFKQQGTSFPIRQTTNQVMTFYTEETDQYEIYVEVNYDDAKERQVYIEYLSGNEIVQSEQEKFSTSKFCMNLFVNTVEPVPIPTKEEIFGESLDYIAQIPAMVKAFNANSQTSGTSIAYMWILLFAVLVMSVITLIDSQVRGRRYDSKMKDMDDTIETVNGLANKLSSLETGLTKPFNEMIRVLKEILNKPQIQERLPQHEKKQKGFMKIFRKDKKKPEENVASNYNELKKKQDEIVQQKTESQEVLESLQADDQDIKNEKEQMQEEPSGGFVQVEESTAEPEPVPDERSPMRTQPRIFKEIVAEINLKEQKFKEGALEKFTYNELNESFGWISEYTGWVKSQNIDVPQDKKDKQLLIQNIIYHAVLEKIKKRSEI